MSGTSLTRAADFARVLAHGARVRRNGIALSALPSGDRAAPSRTGLVVGRAAGGAVVRNRVKRRLRAALRALDVPPGYLLVVRGGPEVAAVPFHELVDHLKIALTRATAARGGS